MSGLTTERFCCDGRCNERQGRGGCPRHMVSEPSSRFWPVNPAEWGACRWPALALLVEAFIIFLEVHYR